MIYSFTMFDRIKIEFRLTNHRSQYFIILLSVRYLMWFYSKCVFIFGFQWKYFIKKKSVHYTFRLLRFKIHQTDLYFN